MLVRNLKISVLFFSFGVASATSSQANIEPSSMPAGNVDVISGAYSDQAADHVVRCVQPIEITRNFCTLYMPNNVTSDWEIMCDRINMYIKPKYSRDSNPSIAVRIHEGMELDFVANGRTSLREGDSRVWEFFPHPDKGCSNTAFGEISGQHDIHNYWLKLDFTKTWATFALTRGSGEKYKYCCMSKWWSHQHYRASKKKNEWSIKDYFFLQERTFPNGNRHLYKYDSDHRLRDIRSVNSKGDVEFGWIHFEYNGEHVTVTTSDNREITYKKSKGFLREAVSPINGKEIFAVHGVHPKNCPIYHLDRIDKPDGRFRQTVYCRNGESPLNHRALKQYAPLGRDQKAILEYEYKYGTSTRQETYKIDVRDADGNYHHSETRVRTVPYFVGRTDVVDACGNTTHYEYSKDKITKIIRPDKSYITQEWGNQKRLKNKSFYDPSGNRIHSRRFTYDPRGNVLKETLVGDLEGKGKEDEYTKTFTYSDNGLNLLLSEEDEKCKITYAYKPGTNLLTEKHIYDGNALKKEESFEYDHNAVLVKHVMKWGSQELTTTYKNRTEQPAIGFPEDISEYSGKTLIKRTHLRYDKHNQVIRQDVYGSSNTLCYSTCTDYDSRGRVIRKVNPLEKESHYEYDENNNCTSLREGDTTTTFTYDFSNRLIVLNKKNKAGEHVSEHYTYDYLHRKTSSTDFSGNVTKYEYDAMGNCTKTIHPYRTTVSGHEEHLTVTRTYDHQGNVLAETNPNGCTTKTYNSRKQVTSIQHPDKSEEFFRYALNGELKEQINRNRSSIIYTRDYLGRILTKKLVSPDGRTLQTTTTTYDGPNKASETDAREHTTKFTYDKAGRLLSQKKGNQSIHYTYDNLGRKSTQRKGDRVTLWTYDDLNRIVEQRLQDSDRRSYSRIQYAYDRYGNKICTTTYQSNKSLQTRKTFDILNKETSSTDPLGNTTHTSYDRAFTYEGRPSVQQILTNAKGHKTITIYNYKNQPLFIEKRGDCGKLLAQAKNYYNLAGNRTQQVQTVYPSKRTVDTRWEYGPGGRLEKLHEAYGTREYKVTAYTYNGCGQLITTTKPSGIKLHRVYDDIGRLSKHYGLDSKHDRLDFLDFYEYDRNNNLISVEGKLGTTTRVYDDNDNLIEETLDTGLTLSFARDNQGRRTQTTLLGNTKIHYTYDAVHLRSITYNTHTHHYLSYDLQGNLLQEKHASNQTSTYTYDPLKRCTSRTSPHYTQKNIKYDSLGNLLSYNDKNFAYNELNQLTSENDHAYAYDSLGNRTKHNDTAYKIDALNQIQASNMEYDAEGRLTRHNDTHYEYDSRDRLTKVVKGTKGVRFTYDAFNRRLTKTTLELSGKKWIETSKQFYLYEKNCEIGTYSDDKITELRVLGRGRGAEIGAAVFIQLDGFTYIPIHNHQGSVTALLDSKGELWESYIYTSFGECTTKTEPGLYNLAGLLSTGTGNPYRFLSKRYDPETGLTFFGRRYYNPSLGRWITPDPKGYKEGPNLYAYVNNNPLTNIDLWGLAARAACRHHSGHHHSNSNRMSRAWNNVRSGVSKFYDAVRSSENYGYNNYMALEKDWYANRYQGCRSAYVGNYPFPKGARITHNNGMGTTYAGALKETEVVAKIFGRKVMLIYSPTEGKTTDISDCFRKRARIGNPPIIPFTVGEIRGELKAAGPGGYVLSTGYSRGAIEMAWAFEYFTPAERNHTHARTIAGGALISSDMVASAMNYCASADFVPKTDLSYFEARAERDIFHEIDVIESPKNAEKEHSFYSPRNQEGLKRTAQWFLKEFPDVEE